MSFLIIIVLVALLYYRTLDYKYIIDDFVKREGYYNMGIVQAPAEIYKMKPSRWYRVFMIGMHIVNCWIIYLLWGFAPALIFAIHPMGVWCTAWVTGNYYGTATYFTLIAYYILHRFSNLGGALVSMFIFNAAINSTVCPLAFPFLGIFEPWLFSLGIMVLWLLKSDRWKIAMKLRQQLYVKPVKFDWWRPVLMTKVIARYTYQAIIPVNLFMFIKFGDACRDDEKQYEEMHRCDDHFVASLLLIGLTFFLGWQIDPLAISWFFILIGLHSQFGMTGQFYAQRYLYLPMIGLIVVIAKLWITLGSPIWLAVVYLGYLFYRSWRFVPVFKDMETFATNDTKQKPPYSNSYNNLAAYIDKTSDNRQHELKALFLKAIEADPNEWQGHFNLAKYYILLKEWKKSLAPLDKTIELASDQNDFAKGLKENRKKIIQLINLNR